MPATAAQTLANRENAARSTGPSTEAGKQTSSRNALQHGLTSKQIVLPGENAADWEALRGSVFDRYRPKTDSEIALTQTIAEATWRLRRIERAEHALFQARMNEALKSDPALDADAALAWLFADPSEMKRLTLLLRYRTTAERTRAAAHKELIALREERLDRQAIARIIERRSAAARDHKAPALRNEPKTAADTPSPEELEAFRDRARASVSAPRPSRT